MILSSLPMTAALCTLAFAGSLCLAAEAPDPHQVAYGGLDDKGVANHEVKRSNFQYPRPRPIVAFLGEGPMPRKQGAVELERVEVTLREPAGTPRALAEVAFGFPLAQGALFDLNHLRVVDAKSSTEQPLQSHILALWPDGSIKSAYLQFQLPFTAGELKPVAVEFGRKVSRQAGPQSPFQVQEKADELRISNGVIEVVVGKKGFKPFQEVYALKPKRRLIAEGKGLELAGEDGTLFSSASGAPESVRIERSGPLDFLVRVEGAFFSPKSDTMMRYVTRLRLAAGSSRAELTVTLVNDLLDNEFSDLSRFGMALSLPNSKKWRASMHSGGEVLTSRKPLSIVQRDENTLASETDGQQATLQGRANGSVEIQTGDDRVQVGLQAFWQRWPKGLAAKPGELRIDFLPTQPDAYGSDFPDHLRFPFVEGRYRLKWGMAFTERLSFDFLAGEPVASLSAAIDHPIQAMLPVAYTAATEVFGALPDRETPLTQPWDRYMDASMELHRQQREKQREYGFLNWGDWYGERGHNWGNNEYDRAHGFFSHFLRTGKGEFLDQAIAIARHQADVDIVHAYPDPFYVGANPQHSIGHTGISYQRVFPKTWTYAYDYATSAGNGHTWADGMADSWLLTGDPVVMESLLALGEHIRWAFVPTFRTLGTHERSGGWSIQAALATYRATSDPEYLVAADKIAELALKEWDRETGIWPHELPPPHAGGRSGVMGNSVYNLGILLTGLSKYHAQTKNPEVLACMSRACEWIVKSWREDRAWPYSAGIDGAQLMRNLSPNLNALIYPGLAYTGLATQNKTFLKVAQEAVIKNFPPGAGDLLAKEYSIKIYATSATLALLQEAGEQGLLEPAPTPSSSQTPKQP